MNVTLLEDIKAHILAEPQHFRMDIWTCGTTHCIGGWALHLSGLKIVNPNSPPMLQIMSDGRNPGVAAADVLELRVDEFGDGEDDRLFQLECWPDDLLERYYDTNNVFVENPEADRAQIAAERITRFIATNGADWPVNPVDIPFTYPDGPCETPACQHRCCACGHIECGHANENVQPNCSDCQCSGFSEPEMSA